MLLGLYGILSLLHKSIWR